MQKYIENYTQCKTIQMKRKFIVKSIVNKDYTVCYT